MSACRVLVFDADPSVHELLGKVLKRPGRSIQDVYEQREALESLRHTPCDVVLAGHAANDGLSGFKLLRKLRSLQPEARVIVTGGQDTAEVVRALRERAYSYFHKPIAGAPLADMVQQALEAQATWRDDLKVIGARPEWVTLDVRCKIEAAERATHFIRELMLDLKAAVREDVATAFRELLINGIEHGGKSDPHKRVRVSLMRTSRAVIACVADPGRGFSLDTLPHAAISNPDGSPIQHVEVRLEQGQRPGGFGILMARNLVDDLVYNERGNTAMLVKYL